MRDVYFTKRSEFSVYLYVELPVFLPSSIPSLFQLLYLDIVQSISTHCGRERWYENVMVQMEQALTK